MAFTDISKSKKRDVIFSKYNGRCAYCGQLIDKSNFCVDHLVPLKRKSPLSPGLNEISNLYPACVSCNNSKSDWPLELWRGEILSKIKRLNRESSLYRICKNFGLVSEHPQDIKFYFERAKEWL